MRKLFLAIKGNDNDYYFSQIDSVDINILSYGANLLHYAIAGNNTAAGLDLIRRGIDVNAQDKDGLTPLHYVAEYSDRGWLDLAKPILETGGDLSIQDRSGNGPLWYALLFGKPTEYRLVKLFVEYGADINQKNRVDKSPLDMAKEYNVDLIINLLKGE